MHNMTIGHCTSYVPHGITGPNHPHSLYKQVLNTRASHSCENYAYTTRGGGLTLWYLTWYLFKVLFNHLISHPDHSVKFEDNCKIINFENNIFVRRTLESLYIQESWNSGKLLNDNMQSMQHSCTYLECHYRTQL